MSLKPGSERLIAGVMIAAFVALSLGYSSAPLFEGPDENAHYRFIHDIFSVGPVPDRGPTPDWDTYEYFQAPLYYLMQAVIKQLAPDPDYADYRNVASRYNLGFVYPQLIKSAQIIGFVGNDNVNIWIHTSAEAFPFTHSGTALAVHLMRLFSVVLGAGGVFVCYAMFHTLWPDRPDRRLTALGLVAFWPTLQYSAGVVNNDILVFLTASLALWLVLRQMRDDPTWKGAALLGITLGLALLSKATGLILAVPVGLAVLLDWRRWWRYALLIVAIVLAVAGWWYIRHAIVYHDPTGLNRLDIDPDWAIFGPGGLPPSLIPSHIATLYRRVWARFGFGGVIAPGRLIDTAFDLLTLAGMSGAVLKLAQTVRRTGWRSSLASIPTRQGLVLAAFGMALLAGVLYRTFTVWFGDLGRHLLPDIAGMAAVLAFGLDAWTPPRLRLRLSLSLVSVMATIAMLCLFGFFLPAYRLLPAPTHVEHPLSLGYGGTLELLGADHQTITARAGDLVSLNLYWRALNSSPDNLTIQMDTSGISLFVVEFPPARGLLPPGEWLPGQDWSERYRLWINPQAKPGVYRVYVLVFNRSKDDFLPITNAAGSLVTQPVAAVIVVQ